MHNYEMTIADFVAMRNDSKKLFTAGPSSLLVENITGLMPCFGRGDDEYLAAEDDVLKRLMQMTGHEKIARMQGSGSLALEGVATFQIIVDCWHQNQRRSNGCEAASLLLLDDAKKYLH